MKIRHRCACMVMIGGRLLGTGGIGQAQLGGGTSPGGTGKRVRSPSEKRRWNGNHGPRARIVGIDGARKPQHVETPARWEFNNGRIR